MTYLYLILAACAPVVVLLIYIYREDKIQPEPLSWLLRAFACGIIAFGITFFSSIVYQYYVKEPTISLKLMSISESWVYAFLHAAIPEESAKLLMLWLLLRKNPYFDEHLDGIVYAVCIGLGFAMVENIIYLLQGITDGSWINIGLSRALFAIPAHFLFAVLMGYYYSLYYFGLRRTWCTLVMIWLMPVLIHGIYDGVLFSMEINEMYAAIGVVLFLFFVGGIQHAGRKAIMKFKPNIKNDNKSQ